MGQGQEIADAGTSLPKAMPGHESGGSRQVSRANWHILRDGPSVTVARHLPVRFDVAAQTVLPPAGRLRVAQQIRQDLWRAVQRQRGFSPVVEVSETADGLNVRAGGRVEAARFDRARLASRIAEVLEDGANRRRWVRMAGGRDQ